MILTFTVDDLARCSPEQTAELDAWVAGVLDPERTMLEIRVVADPTRLVVVYEDGIELYDGLASPPPFVDWPADEHGRMAE